MLRNRPLDACHGTPECWLTRQKVADTVQGVIADLHTSISTYQPKPLQSNDAMQAIVIDRHRQPPQYYRNSGAHSRKKQAKCFICHKDGYWSTNNTPAKRFWALGRNKKTRAYIVDILGTDLVYCEDNVDHAEEVEAALAHLADMSMESNTPDDDDMISELGDQEFNGLPDYTEIHPNTTPFISDKLNAVRLIYWTTKNNPWVILLVCSRA